MFTSSMRFTRPHVIQSHHTIMKNSFALALVVVMLASVAEGTECSSEKVNECLAPLTDFDADVNSAVVIYLSEEDLRQHCNLYEEFNLCMRNVRPYCAEIDLLVFEGIDDAYHFMCDEAFDEYLLYRECLNNTELHDEGDYCNTTLGKKLSRLTPNQPGGVDRICQYANDYLDCVKNAVQSFCGTSAARWQRQLDERSLRPLLSRLNCPGLAYNKNWWENSEGSSSSVGSQSMRYIVAVALTVVTLIILVLVVLMLVVYRRKRLQQELVARRVPAQQVHYGPGGGAEGAVSILPTGWTPGVGAGPLPQKGPIPPPYTSTEAAADSSPYPAGGAIPPPAYSDITVRQDWASGGGGGASRRESTGSSNTGGYENPAMVHDAPTYDNGSNYTSLTDRR